MILEKILENLKKYENMDAYQNEKNTYKYSDLYKYTKNIYAYLDNLNKKDKIIVYGHKDILMIASFLACSFSGITYIPIDVSMPKERIKQIISNVKPKLILVTEVIDIDENVGIIPKQQIEQIANNDIEIQIKPELKKEDIYYIIFTSGSTGVPKGVQVTYNNINSFLSWFTRITTNEQGIVLNQAAFSFDLSVADIYLSLITGSKLVVLEKNAQNDYKELFRRLKDSNANIAIITPSFADLLLLDKSFNRKLMPNLKQIYFCGETLQKNTVAKLFDNFKGIKIINSYGPTECTVAVTSILVNKRMLNQETIPIGKCKKDTNIYIVNEEMNILTEGQEGEILISGESVAKGYLGRASNRFIKFEGKNAYLTGDIGYIKNGIVYYKCRKDNQIKYKGYRIELNDIERNLYKLKYIRKAVVISKKDENGKVIRLIGYVEIKNGYKINEIEVKDNLSKLIPKYMCPTIRILDKLPINNNGKCDIVKLKEI